MDFVNKSQLTNVTQVVVSSKST